MVSKISNHTELALERLITQFQDKQRFRDFIEVASSRHQGIEDALFQLFTERTIEASTGFNLDRLGSILNVQRFGLSDDEYRVTIIAKIAANVSLGAPEDMINVFKILMQARTVEIIELYPARMRFNALGADPIGDLQRIKEALNLSKPAGVLIDRFLISQDPYFAFEGNPDPNSAGFGDATDANIGGFWAALF